MTEKQLMDDSANFQKENCGYIHSELNEEGGCKVFFTGSAFAVEMLLYQLVKRVSEAKNVPFPKLLTQLVMMDIAGVDEEDAGDDGLTIEGLDE